jgi:hypothetical protein
MRSSIVVVMLVVGIVCSNSHEAGSRPMKGDKTLGLGMNEITYSKYSWQECDGKGEHCGDPERASETRLGLGLTGGYLLTDLFEVGLGAGLGLSSYRLKRPDYDYVMRSLNWSYSGQAYGRLHFGSGRKLVPFLGGGVRFDMTRARQKSGDGHGDRHGFSKNLWLSGEAGVAYYVAPKYALTTSLGITRVGWYSDDNTDDDYNRTYTQSNLEIRIGLGVSTYF